MWINTDRALNKNITQNMQTSSGVLECMVSGIRKFVQNGVQRPLKTTTYKKFHKEGGFREAFNVTVILHIRSFTIVL